MNNSGPIQIQILVNEMNTNPVLYNTFLGVIQNCICTMMCIIYESAPFTTFPPIFCKLDSNIL